MEMKGWLITKNILKGILGVIIVLFVIYLLLALYAIISSNFGLPLPTRHSYVVDGNKTFSNAIGWKADSGKGSGEIYIGDIQNQYYEGLENNFCFGLRAVSNVTKTNKDCFGIYIKSEVA